MTAIQSFLEQNTAFLPLIATFLLGVTAVLLLSLLLSRRKQEARSREAMLAAQQNLLTSTSERLAERLALYSETELITRVQASYETLVTKDLLPAVNASAQNTAALAEQIAQRQESGMAELAERLAALFTERTESYLQKEAEVVASMNSASAHFCEQLSRASETAQTLSGTFGEIYEQTKTVADFLGNAVTNVGSHLSELGTTLEKNAQFVDNMQQSIVKSSEVISRITETAEHMQRLSTEAVSSVSAQQETTAHLLHDAVEEMRRNTESAAETVLASFGETLSSNGALLRETAGAVRETADAMRTTAREFNQGVDTAYTRFTSITDEKTAQIADAIRATAQEFNQGVDAAYTRFTTITDETTGQIAAAFEAATRRETQALQDAAQSHTQSFTRDVAALREALEGHLNNLHTVTHRLGTTVEAFKSDADASTQRFESGIESMVTSALKEMDSSLAQIVERLVGVTASISEAADALPRAVHAIKKD